jgi:hypothetical protein
LARLPAPLEKIFDPNTLSNYEDNSRNHYGRPLQQPRSDLPLRDDASQTLIKDTIIDLGAHDFDMGLSKFPDIVTIKDNRRGSQEGAEGEHNSTLHDFTHPAFSEPADININRRTQDWKFPVISPPESADPEISRFPADCDLPRPIVIADTGSRPALIRYPIEPTVAAFGVSSLNSQQASLDQLSITRGSLIDLDMSLPDVIAPYARLSTANSNTGSTNSDQTASSNLFELEEHASLFTSPSPEATTKPEYYLSEESAFPHRLLDNSSAVDNVKFPDFSVSDTEPIMRHPPLRMQVAFTPHANQPYTFSHLPELPSPPSEKALSGLATHDELKAELNRMLSSMTSQLEAFRDLYASTQILQIKRQMPRRQDKKNSADPAAANSSISG